MNIKKKIDTLGITSIEINIMVNVLTQVLTILLKSFPNKNQRNN